MKNSFTQNLLIYMLAGLCWQVAAGAAAPAATVAKPSVAETSGKSLPAARGIIDRYVTAVGGRAAILKRSSHHAVGTFEMVAQGLKGNLEVFAAKPNKTLTRVDVPGLGKIEQGFNGILAWSSDPAMGPMILKDKQLRQLRDEAGFYNVLHEEKEFQKMETIEMTDFNGKPCYKLKLVRQSGEETTEYFEVSSGLLAGTTSTQQTALGSMPVTSTVSNYKTFGGILTPTRIVQKVAGMEQVMTISTIEYDKVPEGIFATPPDIQALNQ